MKNIQINIFDTNLVWQNAIDDIQTFVHRYSWNEMPNSELTISRTAQGAEDLQIGRIVIANNMLNKAMIIDEIRANIAEDVWEVNLIPLKALLNYRIAHPTDSGTFTGLSQSEVMMSLVSRNLISQNRDPDRKFWNSDQTINILNNASIKKYGDLIDYTIDWGTGFLGDTLIDISEMYDDIAGKYPIGWNIYIKSSLDGLELDTFKHTNRTINQTNFSPVVFSEDFNNIKDAIYSNSMKDWANMAYVTWNDGSVDQVTAIANIKHGRSTSFNRKEVIIGSDRNKVNEATADGRAELNKRPKVESFTAEIIDNPNTLSTFEKDWFLGDIVTIQSRSLKYDQIISVDTQILEIEEVYDNGEYSINATFGESRLSLIQKIKNAIKQKK